jgi:hypothetical protein
VLVSCFVKLGWKPRLENLTDAAACFRREHSLDEWMRGRDSQLILRAEGDLAYAGRLVRDFHQEVVRSDSVVNAPASWFLVVASRPWEPDDSFSSCIVIEELVLWHVGTEPVFEYSEKVGMCIWRAPRPAQPQPSSPSEDERAGDEPLFSPDGDQPDFIEIEEQ